MSIHRRGSGLPNGHADAYKAHYYCGQHRYAMQQPPALHFHNADELLLVRQGAFCHYIGYEPTFCTGPHMIFSPAGQPHITCGPADTVYERYGIEYMRSLIKDVPVPLSGMKAFVCPLEGDNDILFTYAELLRREYRRPREEKSDLQAEVYLLGAFLGRVYEIASAHVEAIETRFQYIGSVQQYIRENYTRRITVQELTDRFFVCRAKLSRDFRDYTGITITGYINLLRTDYAKELLLAGESVRETASALGFEYESNFISSFKTVTGMTPLQFKRTTEG